MAGRAHSSFPCLRARPACARQFVVGSCRTPPPLHAGRPTRTHKKWLAFKKNHWCSPPWGIKDIKCNVKGIARNNPEVSYAKFCTKYTELRELKGDFALAEKLKYEDFLTTNGGQLLHHSSTISAQKHGMWCSLKGWKKLNPKGYIYNVDFRLSSCESLEELVAKGNQEDEQVYRNNPDLYDSSDYDSSATISSTCSFAKFRKKEDKAKAKGV